MIILKGVDGNGRPADTIYVDPHQVCAVRELDGFGMTEVHFASRWVTVHDPDRKVAQQIAEARAAFGQESGFKTHGERLDILEADMDGIEGEIIRIKDHLVLE